MIKKIVLILVLLISIFGFVHAGSQDEMLLNQGDGIESGDPMLNSDPSNSTSASNSCNGPNCLNSTDFTITTLDITGVNNKHAKTTLKDSANSIFTAIIQNLLVAIGIVAVFVMTVGSGYMIFHHGDDGMLQKGKTMFTTGILAIVIALGSYYLVALIKYLLYN